MLALPLPEIGGHLGGSCPLASLIKEGHEQRAAGLDPLADGQRRLQVNPTCKWVARSTRNLAVKPGKAESMEILNSEIAEAMACLVRLTSAKACAPESWELGDVQGR